MREYTDSLRPIETSYKGYRFRSRLEARWAVFLDAIGVEWEYEKQGFDLNGVWYLPDFWLPYEPMKNEGWGFWLEIKPTVLSQPQIDMLGDLARLTGHRTFAICGNPWPGEHSISIFQHHHHSVPDRIPLVSDGQLVEEDEHQKPGFRSLEFNLPPSPHIRVRSSSTGESYHFVEGYRFWSSCEMGGLDKAFEKARSARFEHGESPSNRA